MFLTFSSSFPSSVSAAVAPAPPTLTCPQSSPCQVFPLQSLALIHTTYKLYYHSPSSIHFLVFCIWSSSFLIFSCHDSILFLLKYSCFFFFFMWSPLSSVCVPGSKLIWFWQTNKRETHHAVSCKTHPIINSNKQTFLLKGILINNSFSLFVGNKKLYLQILIQKCFWCTLDLVLFKCSLMHKTDVRVRG